MPFDSTNCENDWKNIFAEIRSLRAEVADMRSALLSVQKNYDNAVVEVQNLNKNFSALEELLRIVAANQMLGEVEKNLPKKFSPNVSASKQTNISSAPKNNSAVQKSFSSSKNSKETARLNRISEIFEHGKELIKLGVIDNRKAAFNYFFEAANRGHVEAMKWLADCYRYGWGTVKDSYQDNYWRDKYERSR